MNPQAVEPVVRTERKGHTLIITINRPAARNAVNSAVADGIGDALQAANGDREVRAVVLTGAGDLSFCAGADLKALSRGESIAPTGAHRESWGFAGYVCHHIAKPTIAAVNGFALGGGTEIVLASDLAVAVRGANFGLPEVKRGLIAAAGGAFRLPEQIPRKIALEAMLTGEPFDAARAERLGLVNRVVEDGQALSAALELADRIAAHSPVAVQATKQVAGGQAGAVVPREALSWGLSREAGARVKGSEDFRIGARAFADKREPKWTGR
ncbi:2-ketocyclohexanecarboxyl-CoA hydrolase [Streptomyces albus]|uniref:enoyl-CoA hydratase n=1 Tax=Streptomyces albus (strain ATCC 21838 / DSM 41398 / FERM P-419 / JCM 4703 / NBRC 107858) TaxID=1081613 RepID=A0A0B5ENK7_STRA4|nr:2-ketocyclohexanecarboxyl-CoA hydrolase [Streptomyces albus]AOU74711.1 2-ketocyclohexanecarboxyl-CoA hydrolase [Streptomyces albus]AYN30522.1 enoyl-CoA hydratase [Streptomyces albus]